MKNLYRHIATLPLCLLLLAGAAHAQEYSAARRAPNLPSYDFKRLHFGFLLGINNADFAHKSVSNLNPFDSIMVIGSTPSAGFDVGIVTDLRMGNYFNLRFIPQISLIDRTVDYHIRIKGMDMTETHKKIESVNLDLPLLIKMKSSRMHNCRVYVVGGGQLSIDLASQAKKKNKKNPEFVVLKLNRAEFQTQAGVGMDFYANMFKFSIEAKMSYGMQDMLKHEDNVYTNSTEYLKSKIFHISILFE
ncbi:MAG: PorT family protein [Bacteroidales bacterium]|nr:PorT family protein [Bacteroidales bacterium]MBR5665023.1 PorT family protein [Bacteroidales bacterium]